MVDNAEISRLLEDPETMQRVMMEASEQAIRDHRAAGVPLVSSRDDKVVLLDAETLEELPEAEAAKWLSGQRPRR